MLNIIKNVTSRASSLTSAITANTRPIPHTSALAPTACDDKALFKFVLIFWFEINHRRQIIWIIECFAFRWRSYCVFSSSSFSSENYFCFLKWWNLNFQKILFFFRKGLAAAHARGIVHGDIRTHWFLVDLDATLKIAGEFLNYIF